MRVPCIACVHCSVPVRASLVMMLPLGLTFLLPDATCSVSMLTNALGLFACGTAFDKGVRAIWINAIVSVVGLALGEYRALLTRNVAHGDASQTEWASAFCCPGALFKPSPGMSSRCLCRFWGLPWLLDILCRT